MKSLWTDIGKREKCVMKLKDKRVPHCSECDRCKYVVMAGTNTRNYYCYKKSDSNSYGETIGSLGVDHPPKTSPKWCPKRVKE